MSKLTSWLTLCRRLAYTVLGSGGVRALLLLSLLWALLKSRVMSGVELCNYFFLASYFCWFKMNHLLPLCHLWQWHRIPENHFLLSNWPKIFIRKRETVLALQLFSLCFSFFWTKNFFIVFFSVSFHLTFSYTFKETATLRIYLNWAKCRSHTCKHNQSFWWVLQGLHF